MKIAVWHNLPSGGASRALHQHIKGLAERGHHIEVWTSSLADSRFLDVDAYVAQTHILPLTIATRLRIEYIDDVRSLLFLNSTRIKRMMAFCEACAKEIEAGDFDILFANSCHFFNMPFIGRFVKRIPKVLYLQEPNRSLYEAYPNLIWKGLPSIQQNLLKPSYYSSYWQDLLKTHRARVLVREEFMNYQSYDKILVNSYFSNESLLRAYGGPGEVCYLGVDVDLFPFLDMARENFVMGLGSFHPPKGVDTAIRAVARIPESIRPKLVWVGNIGNKDYMAGLITLSQQQGVDFEPRQYVPHRELIQLLNTASCLLYTSTLEPFGFAPLEANACGLPVVAIGEGGVRETVINGYNGLLTGRNPGEIARAMEHVLTDAALFERLSANGRQVVRERWSVDDAVDRLENALMASCPVPQQEGVGQQA
ncbi:glycosyltransferase family 1 protein [Fibrisoma montanum]|uniref:Glycosyltransferase family 1 protein n=1 Tax=Fibrisoma montanum TaxID=2305895 RepID=A0A418M4N8_9BACT|nr:glycosyltransferase family 4 protein [Fibrisoma montanum]RIV20623.1 glycosyltransferase family 1 protein [Fibrisoma montanum]